MPFGVPEIVPVIACFLLSLALTPIVRRCAVRFGMVAKPKADRWHRRPTAMLGGVAIFLAVVITNAAFSFASIFGTTGGLVVLAASAFLFLVGLVDDLLHTKPYQKLIGQVIGAALIVAYGLTLPWTASAALNMVLTIFWLIGITNAINLLDNMDGLAAGVAAIAACFLAASFVANGQIAEAVVVAVFAAALLGFLVYNSNPASIFMGDCGSMFVGFFLASSALLSQSGGRSRSLLPVLAVPVLILFIPIFDTTFVTLLRKLYGRAASQGGRDHTSHRLVALGMSERQAVWMLYGFAALSGVLALLVREVRLDVSLASILGFTVVLVLLGVHLAGVKVYDEREVSSSDNALMSFLVDMSYKRRIFEVLLDVVLIVLAYYTAYALLFDPVREAGAWQLFLRTLPVLVIVKLLTFLVVGVYRGFWRYTSVDDLVVFAKGIALGSIASVLVVLFAFRFEGFSRSVFVLDGLLLLMMVAGSRLAFRLFRRVLPTTVRADGCRVLIYGAGDAGELLLRELLSNRELRYAPIGFVDDDALKKGKVMHGLRVFGGNGQLRSICDEQRIEEVLISVQRLAPERVREIARDCEAAHVRVKRMRIHIEPLGDDEA